jgi:hypothetical protein
VLDTLTASPVLATPRITKPNAQYAESVTTAVTVRVGESGANWYAYCGNNPLSYTDPTGNFANFAIGAILGFVSSTSGEMAAHWIPGMSFGQAFKSTFSDLKSICVIASSMGIGAATSGLSAIATTAAVQGASAVARVAITAGISAVGGAAGSVATDVATKAIHGEKIKVVDELKVAAKGIAISAVTGAAGEVIASSSVAKTVDFTTGTGTRNPTVTFGSPSGVGTALGTSATTVLDAAAGISEALSPGGRDSDLPIIHPQN